MQDSSLVTMNDFDMAYVALLAFWLAGVIIGLWVLWAIIRGAVLSALRKHAYEQDEERRSTQR